MGSASGQTITLPSAVLRAAAIEIMGSGLGSVAIERLVSLIGVLMQAAVPAGLKIATQSVPLSEVGQAWTRDDGGRRIVFTVD